MHNGAYLGTTPIISVSWRGCKRDDVPTIPSMACRQAYNIHSHCALERQSRQDRAAKKQIYVETSRSHENAEDRHLVSCRLHPRFPCLRVADILTLRQHLQTFFC